MTIGTMHFILRQASAPTEIFIHSLVPERFTQGHHGFLSLWREPYAVPLFTLSSIREPFPDETTGVPGLFMEHFEECFVGHCLGRFTTHRITVLLPRFRRTGRGAAVAQFGEQHGPVVPFAQAGELFKMGQPPILQLIQRWFFHAAEREITVHADEGHTLPEGEMHDLVPVGGIGERASVHVANAIYQDLPKVRSLLNEPLQFGTDAEQVHVKIGGQFGTLEHVVGITFLEGFPSDGGIRCVRTGERTVTQPEMWFQHHFQAFLLCHVDHGPEPFAPLTPPLATVQFRSYPAIGSGSICIRDEADPLGTDRSDFTNGPNLHRIGRSTETDTLDRRGALGQDMATLAHEQDERQYEIAKGQCQFHPYVTT